jgi:hypothetical protein
MGYNMTTIPGKKISMVFFPCFDNKGGAGTCSSKLGI